MNALTPCPKPIAKPKTRKRMKQVSDKRRARRQSQQGQDETAHMMLVKTFNCSACGKSGPSEAHHCKDKPPFDQQDIYTQIPCAGRKSGDLDTIPLCAECHRTGPSAYHHQLGPSRFHALHGPDWKFIEPTRQKVAALEADILGGWL